MDKRSPYVSAFYVFLIIFSAIIIIISLFYDNYANARSPQEEYRQMQQEIKTQKKKLESVKKTEKNVTGELRRINSEIAEIENKLKIQRLKIDNLQNNIFDLRKEISNYNRKLTYQVDLLKKRIKSLQRITFENDPLLIVLSGEDPSQVLKSIRYLKDISAYDQSLIKGYHATLNTLNEKVKKLKVFEAELQVEEDGFKKLEASYKDKKSEKEKFLVSVRKEKSHYENMIREIKESSNKMLKIIEESNKKERELKKRKGIETKPGIKDEDLPEYSAFTRLKGRLPWPVIGTIAVSYGSQSDPLFNLPVFRSGIHIKSSANSQIKSVYEGKVVFADSFKGFGQLVILNHGGGYHTLYGNLSRIFLQNGAIIKERQIIGEAGESQLIGTHGLYFEIRYKGKPLNPEHWLKKA